MSRFIGTKIADFKLTCLIRVFSIIFANF